MKSLQEILTLACCEKNIPWALATIVRTHGSTYRKAGARLLVSPDGGTTGVLSGGCLEEEVAAHGLQVMNCGSPRLVDFDTRRLYGCVGRLEVFIERIPPARVHGNLLTDMARMIRSREAARVRIPYQSATGRSELIPSRMLLAERDDVFTETITLPTRLLIFGSGPEILPLKVFATGLGWVVQEYAHPGELPEETRMDAHTAAIIMTHHFGRDLAALDRLLPAGLPYIGLLGPRRRHSELIARLRDYRELDPRWLDHLHAPAGLDLGSGAPEQIALSIIAEISAILSGRSGGLLKNRPLSIHEPATIGKKA